MSRRLAFLLATAIVAAACGNSDLGRSIPACPADDDFISEVSPSMILQMQAVDSAAYVPCVTDLKAGWSYEHLVADRGKSRFALDSDRLGSGFLEVSLLAACETDGLASIPAPNDDVAEYRSIELVGTTVTVVIVPETGRVIEYAHRIEAELEARQINGREVFVVFDDADAPLADKVAQASRQGRPLVILDEEDVLEGTATLRMPGRAASVRGLDFEDLVDALEDRLPKPSLRGTWVQVFAGGCIRFDFDATGHGVDGLVGDVEEAIGLFPAEEVRQIMRDAGLLG
ncbi:MAG: hypothetical protein HKN74_12955 [Acidimicrobiia bacterium]|nr:hypothetical protein [Acidimicrobiia bacterium]MBT8216849.1 hypothetical protein [Acidimicrobiia bacterium]NNF11183.1 hypothetical protein [Acidimicrobiia bacterium]NNL69908.1 hypothetical protein [Acidimicrobiia bacterium]